MTASHVDTPTEPRVPDEDTGLAVFARDIRKVYGPTAALAGVNFTVRAGEIHGLLGENGAGKSTLVRILAGVERPDHGELTFFGEPASGGPKDRQDAGLAFIHQNLGLFPNATVADTIALSSGYRRRFGLIDQRATTTRAQALVDRLGFDCDVSRPVGELPPAEQTLVAVARALADGARLIVLDEPTAYLEARQVRILFDILAGLRAEGVAVIMISHRSEDILRVCDRVTVLRDGRDVASEPVAGMTEADLISLITGRGKAEDEDRRTAKDASARSPKLTVEGLEGQDFGPVSFTIGRGEIVGICGLADAGQNSLGRALIGDVTAQGSMSIDGRAYRPRNVRDALAAGIGYVPGDRAKEGLAGLLSAADNILMKSAAPWWRPLTTRDDQSRTQALMERFRVSPAAPQREVSTFSGGNQQKILLAKWLGAGHGLVILNEPSAGVDIGAKADIHAQIKSTCDTGAASALVISTDFQEIVDLCDRALVMRRGLIVGEINSANATAELLTELAYGGTL